MEFEYHLEKSKINLKKHGIDFEEAQQLWKDPNRLEIQARSDLEPRFALIAKYKNQFWSAFYTTRETKIRIISVRRSRKQERGIYEGRRLR